MVIFLNIIGKKFDCPYEKLTKILITRRISPKILITIPFSHNFIFVDVYGERIENKKEIN